MKDKRIPPAVIKRIWADKTIRLDDAAAKLGITRQGLAYKAKALGLPPRGMNQALIKRGTDEQFRALWFAGVPVKEMARVLGYACWRGVIQRREMMGLPKRTRGHGTAKHAGWEQTTPLRQIAEDALAARMAASAAETQAAMAAVGMQHAQRPVARAA